MCRGILDEYAKAEETQGLANDSLRPKKQRHASLLDAAKGAVQGVLRPESAGVPGAHGHHHSAQVLSCCTCVHQTPSASSALDLGRRSQLWVTPVAVSCQTGMSHCIYITDICALLQEKKEAVERLKRMEYFESQDFDPVENDVERATLLARDQSEYAAEESWRWLMSGKPMPGSSH